MCVRCWDRFRDPRRGENIIIESMLMDSFISEVCRIAALNLGELLRIVDCSI